VASYIPRRGDIVWLTFNPQAGHEQAGRRPAFVVSPYSYNKKVGLFLVCPITSQIKGYPFEVRISSKSGINGVVLADQIKNLDWKARRAEFVESAEKEVIDAVSARLLPLIEEDK
jgi:mRNA interferase MazF